MSADEHHKSLTNLLSCMEGDLTEWSSGGVSPNQHEKKGHSACSCSKIGYHRETASAGLSQQGVSAKGAFC